MFLFRIFKGRKTEPVANKKKSTATGNKDGQTRNNRKNKSNANDNDHNIIGDKATWPDDSEYGDDDGSLTIK